MFTQKHIQYKLQLGKQGFKFRVRCFEKPVGKITF